MTWPAEKIPSVPVRIEVPNAGPVLQGALHDPGDRRLGSVLVCHPHPAFGGCMDVPLVVDLAEGLARGGLAALRFNFRGVGESGGRGTGGEKEHLDLLAALAWLHGSSGTLPHLVGYSFGAVMALAALVQGGRASSLCCIGFASTVLIRHAEREAGARRALQDLPVLFLCGEQDQFCDAGWIRSRLSGPRVQVEVLADQGHFFEGEAAAGLVRRVVCFVGGIEIS